MRGLERLYGLKPDIDAVTRKKNSLIRTRFRELLPVVGILNRFSSGLNGS